MERLYLVGKSSDDTKLYFARTKDAKSGSLEVVITDDLLEVLRDAERRRNGETETGASPEEASGRRPPVAAPPEPLARPRGRPRGGLPPGSFERATQITGKGVEAVIRKPPEHEPPPEPADSSPARPLRDPRPSSRLTPAEIQRLLRAGRGIRSVARQAEASVEWVRRLARPIESERVGMVIQLLRAHQSDPARGRCAVPIGAAIVEHLREQGVPAAARVVEEGWTAFRPEGREWRIRFTYEWRGRRHRAAWSFDPQSGEASPADDAAAALGFRDAVDRAGPGSEGA